MAKNIVNAIEEVVAEVAVETVVENPTKYVVATGKAIITLKGVLGAGEEIKPKYFKAQEAFDDYLEKGYIVKAENGTA